MNRASRYWFLLKRCESALDGILDLHARVALTPAYKGVDAICDHCDVAYPCATVEIIQNHLDGKQVEEGN